MAGMWNGAKNILVQGGTFVAKTIQHAPVLSGTLNINVFPRTEAGESLERARFQGEEDKEDTQASISSTSSPNNQRRSKGCFFSCTGVIAAVVLCAAASFNLTLKEYNVSSSSAHILSLPPAVEIYGRDQLVKDAVDKILSQFKDKSKVKRHISIKGGPGMGKTTIAIGIIHDSLVIKYFQDARHWVSCREASKVEDTMKASKLLEYISDSLGLELTASNDRRKDIKYFLDASNHIPRILVLDNFETMWEPHGAQQAVEDILKFLSQFTQLTIVLTTRNAYDPVTHLGVSWHQFDAIEPLSLEASKQLFTSLAPSRSIDDRLEDLLRAVDCIPLPIVLMASSAQESYTTSRILEIWNRGLMAQYNLTSSLGVHDGDPMDVLDRWIEMSLEGPLIKSRPNAITLLRMIAALPSGIRHESLWDISRIQDVDRVAAVLVRTSLITNSPFILQMHSTIRSYMLRNHALSGKYRAQIKEFYFQLIHAAGAEPGAKDFLSHARRLSDEQINAEAILSDALEHDFEPAIWIAMDYCNYLIWNTPSTDIAEKSVQILRNKLLGINKFTQQLDHDNESPFSVEMVNHIYPLALLRLGVLYFRLDNYPEAINALEEAANMGRSLEQTRWTSQAEIYLAEIYRLRGDHTRALGLYSSAYNRSEENFRERASAQRGMAIVHFQDNSFSEALRALETVRDSCPAEDHSCRADCDRELGRLYRNRNQSESIRYSSNARAYYLVHGPRREAAIALYQKSIALYLQGDYDAAETGLKEAFEEFKPLRNDAQMGFCVFHLAEMNRVRGTLNQALALFQRSEMMFEHMENKFMVGLSLKGQAETQARLCRSKEASKASKRAHHLLRTIDAKEATSAVIDTGDLRSMCQWEYAVRENCNMLMLPISCLAVLLIFYYVFIRK